MRQMHLANILNILHRNPRDAYHSHWYSRAIAVTIAVFSAG